jgi:hypothetical protein
MITITNAATYSIQGEMAYAITYSEGTEVRAIEGKGIIRKEHKKNGVWVLTGKAYVVDHSKPRAAEQIKKQVLDFLAQ